MPADGPHTGSLRAENRRRATERIVDAAADLVRERGDTSFSMPEVAQRSGVSLRTLYRYFPSRNDLIHALAGVADQVVAVPRPTTVDELEPWLVTAWNNLLAEEALLRAQHQGPGGIEVRRARAASHREATTRVLDTIRPGLDPARLDDLVDITLLVTSSTALFEFVDVIGIDVERGARLVAQAISALLAQS
jgi:AcrR family transcriptional regulator